MPKTLNNIEIIQIAEAVARDKGIGKQAVLHAMEQAIQVASKKKYGMENKINAVINQSTGEIKITRVREVVETLEDPHIEILLQDAKLKKSDAEIGDIIEESLPPIDLARVSAQSAKQVIIQKVREAEKEKQYEEFKDKVGEIVNGTVKRIEFGNVILDLSRGEGIIRRNSLIRGEIFKVNERVRAYIEEVKNDIKGQQIILSRTHNEFLAKLFAQEVPEIYDRIIEIKAIVREPGARSKVAVYTSDFGIDPVGSCVGVRGSRIQAVINELCGEKIDIIKWVEDPAKFVVNALTPAEVEKVIIDEDTKKIEVVVPNDQLSIAIGRRGQNVRLASKITGWNIDVLTEEEESKRRTEEFNTSSEAFIAQLGLEEVLAQLLAAEGFANIEDIAYSSDEELESIEGIDADLAKELVSRAKKVVAERDKNIFKELKTLGMDKEMLKLFQELMAMDKVLILANAGIKNFEDLAEISIEEFKEILPDSGLEDKYLNDLIEKAKAQA
jgi:transcription termination/antitermination protein NusA